VTWQPYEIKTLRLATGATAPVEVDMLESATVPGWRSAFQKSENGCVFGRTIIYCA
jgi:hypothetical protein